MKNKVKSVTKITPSQNFVNDFLNSGYQFRDRNSVIDKIYKHKDKEDFVASIHKNKIAFKNTNAGAKNPRVSNQKKANALKVLNVVGYFGIIVGCMYQCFSFLAIYFKFPTTVEMNVTNANIMEFPAVTICNNNP